MKRCVSAVLVACFVSQLASPAMASVNVNRSGEENPMAEVARSVVYGGLAGLFVGTALAVGTKGSEHDGDYLRWGFAGGTLLGLGMGLVWVTQRPQPSGLIEVQDGTLRAHLVLPQPTPQGGVRLVAARVSF